MSEQKEFTLKQIMQIAFSGDKFGIVNTSLLYAIIKCLLNKLNCENEKVILRGTVVANFKEILRKSQFEPPIYVNDEHVKKPMKLFEKANELEEKVYVLEEKLEKHLKSHKTTTKKDVQRKTMCEVEEQKDKTISALLKNEFLIKSLNDCLSTPILCHMHSMEINLNRLSDALGKFKADCSEAHEKLNNINKLTEKFFILRTKVNRYCVPFGFIKELIEIQAKMDLKADNCDIIEFKLYFQKIIEDIVSVLQGMVTMETKPRALISVVEPLRKKSHSPIVPKLPKKLVCDCDENAQYQEPEDPDLRFTLS